jgi:hypothetical protein
VELIVLIGIVLAVLAFSGIAIAATGDSWGTQLVNKPESRRARWKSRSAVAHKSWEEWWEIVAKEPYRVKVNVPTYPHPNLGTLAMYRHSFDLVNKDYEKSINAMIKVILDGKDVYGR